MDIASIGVHASVVEVGMTGGAQAVTPSAHVLFHWQHGVVPGNRGSAVLAGHTCLFAPSCAGHGVFNRLGSLKRGNLIRVRVGRHTVTFKVTSVQHNAHPTAKQVRSMYATSGPSRLVLVTCGDPQSDGEYYAHIIVRAKRVK